MPSIEKPVTVILAWVSMWLIWLCVSCGILISAASGADLIWWDGTRDTSGTPPGKLLSDNLGYWGDCVLTGMEYRYEILPDAPSDVTKSQDTRPHLVDGVPDDPRKSVGRSTTGPLVVVFDFKRTCMFSEVDICTLSRRVAIHLQISDTGDNWKTVYQRNREECDNAALHRLPLAYNPPGRYLRLSVEGESVTYLDEVLVWGDADVNADTPEDLKPIAPTPAVDGCVMSSITGIAGTSFPDFRAREWKRRIGINGEQPAVWSSLPTWGRITDKPILPDSESILRQFNLSMARNETECAALALTNTSIIAPASIRVSLSPFRAVGADNRDEPGLAGKLRCAGVVGSRYFGANLGPLFEEGNLLGTSLLRRYVNNAENIKDFPDLHLSPTGSAVIWLSVTSDGVPPGEYEADLRCTGCKPVTIRVKVLDVTLPKPFVWLNTWSGTTRMFPFVYADRQKAEIEYMQSLGLTVWQGFPTPGSDAEFARKNGRTIFHIWSIGDYGDKGWANQIKAEDLTADDYKAIDDYFLMRIRQAKELGLDYNDWFAELWDEPRDANTPLFAAIARHLRTVDPEVRLYCNPCFWNGYDVSDDNKIYSSLADWYNDCIDVSVPFYTMLQDRPKSWKIFDKPRVVRASYEILSHSAKSDQPKDIECYRRLAWDAFDKGWNGWGFYAYYRPLGDPWNDMDGTDGMPDFQVVYPGPKGPVPTRQSESVREGWEDFCILTLLKEHKMNKELDSILKSFKAGKPMSDLRLRALKALSSSPG